MYPTSQSENKFDRNNRHQIVCHPFASKINISKQLINQFQFHGPLNSITLNIIDSIKLPQKFIMPAPTPPPLPYQLTECEPETMNGL